jgi:preprotein translocase subunit SecE
LSFHYFRSEMGRLLKKKESGKQKKKKENTVSESTMETTIDETGGKPEFNGAVTSGLKSIMPKKTAPIVKTAVEKREKNFIGKSIQFLREVKVELKKVTWPSKKQTMGSTAVVIVVVMIISLFLGIVDMGLSGLVRIVLQ